LQTFFETPNGEERMASKQLVALAAGNFFVRNFTSTQPLFIIKKNRPLKDSFKMPFG